MHRSKVYIPSDVEFTNIIKTSHSYSDCLRKLGLGSRGGSSTDILKQRIKELNLSTQHFKQCKNESYRKYSMEEILVENSTYTSINCLKRRLINENLLDYKCAICGISEWNGKTLSLQLDHINGINTDHRIKNLRFLCPNCHSQTDTYAGKNKILKINNVYAPIV